MYEDYYGFVQPPFSLTPDPRFLYRSESHDLALQQVWQAIRRKEGFIVLTGDIGTGKTTLCRTLLEQFDETTFTALDPQPVSLGRGTAARSAPQLRRGVEGCAEVGPPVDGQQARADSHAARLPAVARPAARQRRADHRRSAAPVAGRARRDSRPLEPRDQRPEAPADRDRRPVEPARRAAQGRTTAARSADLDPLLAEGADARRGRGLRDASAVGGPQFDIGAVHAQGVRSRACALGRRAARDQPALRSIADDRVREADEPDRRRARRSCRRSAWPGDSKRQGQG